MEAESCKSECVTSCGPEWACGTNWSFGTKYNQSFWPYFRLFYKHFQRLDEILGLVGAGLDEPWEGFLTSWVWVPSPGALVGKPRIEQRF